jgi:hypothetical protein
LCFFVLLWCFFVVDSLLHTVVCTDP